MEFKGTKGKWVLEDTENWINLIDSNGDRITSIDVCDSRSPYDALLISKAPEMLEMLKKVLGVNEHHGFDGHSINKQIEKLIREATEL